MSATNRTADEVKADNILAMGQELGPLYDALWQQVAWLHTKWGQYIELFGTKPSRIALLNNTAPTFFGIVQDTFWKNVILHIARLTDSPKSAGKPNLSFRRLPDAIGDDIVKARVTGLITKALKASEFCRDWRNRHIAHRDLHLALGQGANPLEPASREKVKEALEALVEVLNAISAHYHDSTTFFDLKDGAGGAVSLLFVLDDGIKAEAIRHERLKNGTFSSDDYAQKDI